MFLTISSNTEKLIRRVLPKYFYLSRAADRLICILGNDSYVFGHFFPKVEQSPFSRVETAGVPIFGTAVTFSSVKGNV